MAAVNILSVCVKISNLPEVAKFKASVGRASVVETLYPLSPSFSFSFAATIDDVTVPDPHTDGDYTIPTVNAFACITGMGEDQFFEDVVAALKSVGK